METLLLDDSERNTTGENVLEYRHGFESIRRILRRVLEEQMTDCFNPALSLQLDAAIVLEEQDHTKGVC